jgi:hypothetical protein
MNNIIMVHLVKPDGETPEIWRSDGAGRALVAVADTAMESGTATGGSNTTLEDTTKGWQVNIWEDAILEVEIGGIQYTREIDSNAASVLDFSTNPLPGAVVVAAGCPYSIKRMVSPMSPLSRAIAHNVAVIGGADILGAALAPLNTPCLFRVAAGFDTAGVLSVTITRGGNTQVQQFNHGVVLVANCLYMFDHLVHSGDTINYRYSVNATLQTLRVQEIIAATQ